MKNTVQLSDKVRIQDAADYLGVSTKTLRRWSHSKKLIAKRTAGNQRYYLKEDLENFANKNNLFPTSQTIVSEQPIKQQINTNNNNVSKWLLASSIWTFVFSFGNYTYIKNFKTTKTGNVGNVTNSVNKPQVLAASTTGLSETSTKYTFTVNVPAKFNETVNFQKDISAPNIVNSVNGQTGDVDTSFSLEAGTGISIDGLKITNSGITSLTAGTNIEIDGNKITNTYSFTPDYGLSGWTDNGTSITLTTTSDTVTVGTLTAGAVTVDSLTTGGLSLTNDLTVASGHSLMPAVDLGSDIGSSTYRFNNLWVANINSNSSQAFSGQTTFSYAPTDTTIDEASVLINPTTSVANGQLLGLAIAGYQKAVIDEDGDIILGYNSLTSAPATDYPLDIYGHSGTRVAYIDSSGKMNLSGSITASNLVVSNGYGVQYSSYAGLSPTSTNGLWYSPASSYIFIDSNNDTTNQVFAVVKDARELGTHTELFRVQEDGNVGIGTSSPSQPLTISPSNNTGFLLTESDSTNPAIKMTSNVLSGTLSVYYNNSIYSQIDGYGSNNSWLVGGPYQMLGIGTSSPTAKMHVNGAITGKALAIFNETGDQNILTASASGTTRFVVTNSGNVGIGTTNPGAQLDVQRNANYSSSSYGLNVLNQGIQSAASQSLYGAYIKAQRNNDGSYNNGNIIGLYVEAKNNTGREPDNFTGIEVANTGLLQMNNGSIYGIKINPIAATPCCSMTTTSYGLYIGAVSGGTNNYGLYSNGGTNYFADNVGIGTTSPTSKLHVSGAVTGKALAIFDETGDQALLTASASGVTKFVVDHSGNVGIGTSSPSGKLEIVGSADDQQLIVRSNSTQTANLTEWQNSSGTATSALSANQTTFYTSGTTGYTRTSPAFSMGEGNTQDLVLWGNAGGAAFGTKTANRIIDIGFLNNNTGYVAAAPINIGSLYNASLQGTNSGYKIDLWRHTSINNYLADQIGLKVKGAISQSANLQEWQNSGGTTLSLIDYQGWGTFPRVTSEVLQNVGYIRGTSAGGALKIQDAYTGNVQMVMGGGNVGIGTTSPTSKLHVSGAVTGKALAIFDETGDQALLTASASGVTKFVVDHSGNVGIGTSSPSQPLDIVGNAALSGTLIASNSSTSIAAKVISSTYFTGTQSLSLLAGTTSGNISLQAGGSERLLVNGSTGGVTLSSLTTGTVYSNNGVLTNTDPSDINLKQNILELPDGTLSKVLGLKPVSYEWKSTGDGALGFIAQEVAEVFPELVGTNSDGTLGLYTTQFIPVLAKAIQEQQLKINLLDPEAVATLSGQVAGVSKQVSVLEQVTTELKNLISAIRNRFVTKELCIGETEEESVCINKDQLKMLLETLPTPTPSTVNNTNTAQTTQTPEPTSVPTVIPSTETTTEPISSTTPEASVLPLEIEPEI